MLTLSMDLIAVIICLPSLKSVFSGAKAPVGSLQGCLLSPLGAGHRAGVQADFYKSP